MQGAPLFFREVVTFIICHKVDDRPVPQSGRLVKHDAAILNARSEGAHGATIRAYSMPRNSEMRGRRGRLAMKYLLT